MATSTRKTSKKIPDHIRQARTPEGREQEIQALAMDLAYQRLKDGTASNQLICEVIKSASSERKLKREIMQEQKELLKAKTSAIKTQEQMNVDYQQVLKAVKRYSGEELTYEDEEDENVF